MKKITLILFLSLFTMSFLINGCGGKYSDVNKLNEEYIALMENYIADLDKADNAKDAAKAMNRFADGMENLWPRMQKLSEKYPELKDNRSNPPEELKETQERAEQVGRKMVGSMMKTMPYVMDPEVQKAQQRIAMSMMKK
jgi:hypothetical protein